MGRQGFRGWSVEYKDGSVLDESQHEWKDIPKKDIACLTLCYDGREWAIRGKDKYFQKKSASAIPGQKDSFRIISRSIGYYDESTIILYTVNEDSGRMTMEVKHTK